MAFIKAQSRGIIRIALATAFLLTLPFVAMQFTDEVTWSPGDFAVAGILLFGAGLTYQLVASRGRTIAYRAAVGVAVATGLLLVWMNLAVGLIGNEDNPANLLYGGVLVLGVIGAGIARLRPHGMALALFATALAQALVPVIALIIWKPPIASVKTFLILLGPNTLFVLLFVGSALLFRRATRPHSEEIIG